MKNAHRSGFALIALASLLYASCASAPRVQNEPSAAKARAQALVQAAQAAPQAPAQPSGTATEPTAAAPVSATAVAGAPGQLTPQEAAILQNYRNTLKYMVYYGENADVSPRLAEAAVSQANRFLRSKMNPPLEVIDYETVESNKKDRQAVYQEETGGSVDIVQYLAEKVNADVYLKLDFALSTETRDKGFYATASGKAKIFDTTTGRLLGDVSLVSPKVYHPSSMDDAKINALQNSVWEAMPILMAQFNSATTRGIGNEVILINSFDAEMVLKLVQSLSRKVRDVEMVSYSPTETRLELYLIEDKSRMQMKVLSAMLAAAKEAGFVNFALKTSRGKSYTFTTGM
jgi:hypothetical protein